MFATIQKIMLNSKPNQYPHEPLLAHPPNFLLFHDFVCSLTKSMRCFCKILPFSTPLLTHFRGAQGALPNLPPAPHPVCPPCCTHSKGGGGARPRTCGAGAEPVGRLQLLDASRVLAGDVDGGGLRRWRVKPRLAGGLGVWGEDLGNRAAS